MPGSYNHIITDTGQLISNEEFPKMIENLEDAYETIREMYGMIWWLAALAGLEDPAWPDLAAAVVVERARQNYQTGIELAKERARSKYS
jgi:hypothetical protein